MATKSGKREGIEKDRMKSLVTPIEVNMAEVREKYMPGVSIDTVIFSFHDDELKVLLIRYGDIPFYCLPGGFIEKTEELDDAALRILKERSGIGNIYLEQFYTTGAVNRSQGHMMGEWFQELAKDKDVKNWFDQRFISVCYYALIDEANVELLSEEFVTEMKWVDVKKLPKLYLDHALIVKKAIERLQIDLDQKLVGFNLLNETFTMGELQKLYEAVYQKAFDRTNFQRKMLSMNILERLEKKYTGKAYKAPYLYRFISKV